jgi:uncharacterized MAPEG superfamily protein
MISVIILAALLYLLQIILPMVLVGRGLHDYAERAQKSVHNYRESLPVFFAFAIISSYSALESNMLPACLWLALRVVFTFIYTSGINLQASNEAGYEAQPIRSIIWLSSVICLIAMGVNLF